MSRLILATILLVSAVCSFSRAEPPTRQRFAEELASRMCHGYVIVGPANHFLFTGDIVQPEGGIRRDQQVVCDRRSLVIRDVQGTTSDLYPVDEDMCAAIVRRLVAADCPSGERRPNHSE